MSFVIVSLPGKEHIYFLAWRNISHCVMCLPAKVLFSEDTNSARSIPFWFIRFLLLLLSPYINLAMTYNSLSHFSWILLLYVHNLLYSLYFAV